MKNDLLICETTSRKKRYARTCDALYTISILKCAKINYKNAANSCWMWNNVGKATCPSREKHFREQIWWPLKKRCWPIMWILFKKWTILHYCRRQAIHKNNLSCGELHLSTLARGIVSLHLHWTLFLGNKECDIL